MKKSYKGFQFFFGKTFLTLLLTCFSSCDIAASSPFHSSPAPGVRSWEKQVRQGTRRSWRGRSWTDRGGDEEEEEESPHMTAVACLLVLGKDTGISQQKISLSFYLSVSASLSLPCPFFLSFIRMSLSLLLWLCCLSSLLSLHLGKLFLWLKSFHFSACQPVRYGNEWPRRYATELYFLKTHTHKWHTLTTSLYFGVFRYFFAPAAVIAHIILW